MDGISGKRDGGWRNFDIGFAFEKGFIESRVGQRRINRNLLQIFQRKISNRVIMINK